MRKISLSQGIIEMRDLPWLIPLDETGGTKENILSKSRTCFAQTEM